MSRTNEKASAPIRWVSRETWERCAVRCGCPTCRPRGRLARAQRGLKSGDLVMGISGHVAGVRGVVTAAKGQRLTVRTGGFEVWVAKGRRRWAPLAR